MPGSVKSVFLKKKITKIIFYVSKQSEGIHMNIQMHTTCCNFSEICFWCTLHKSKQNHVFLAHPLFIIKVHIFLGVKQFFFVQLTSTLFFIINFYTYVVYIPLFICIFQIFLNFKNKIFGFFKPNSMKPGSRKFALVIIRIT